MVIFNPMDYTAMEVQKKSVYFGNAANTVHHSFDTTLSDFIFCHPNLLGVQMYKI